MEALEGDDDAAYMELLEQQRKQIAAANSGAEGAEIDDEWTDDEEIDSALEQLDPFGMLVLTMNNLQAQEPAQFQVCICWTGPC